MDQQYSTYRPRQNTAPSVPEAQIADFGIPGIPFVKANPASPVFSQGEDVVYDCCLRIDGKPIMVNEWTITIPIKKDSFTQTVLWSGSINNGLYYDKQKDLYQIWIPSTVTSQLLAGTYWFDVVATERIGTGSEIRSRTVVLFSTSFCIQYTSSSPHPDSASPLPGKLTRVTESSYPNLYPTLSPAGGSDSHIP